MAEDGDEVVDLLYLLPLQIEERLQDHIVTITLNIIAIAVDIIFLLPSSSLLP